MKRSDLLAKQLADELERERLQAERYGEDKPDGTVIKFKIRFHGSRIRYQYAAIRVRGLWYLTGAGNPGRHSWDQLTDWFDCAESVSRIKVWGE